MKTLLKFVGYFVVGVIALVVIVQIGSRFTDGPTEILAGGAFTSGELDTTNQDWSFLKDRNTVEFQLEDPARSRTTWIVEHNNRIYIPCGYMNSTWGRIWKQWPIQAEQDGRSILRVDGKLYERTLVRVKQHPDLEVIVSELGRKYLGGQSNATIQAGLQQIAEDSLWIFELAPRA